MANNNTKSTKEDRSWVLILGVIAGAFMLCVMMFGALVSAGALWVDSSGFKLMDHFSITSSVHDNGKTVTVSSSRNEAYDQDQSGTDVVRRQALAVKTQPWTQVPHLMNRYEDKDTALRALAVAFLKDQAWAHEANHETRPERIQIRGHATASEIQVINAALLKVYDGDIHLLPEAAEQSGNYIDRAKSSSKTFLDRAKEESKSFLGKAAESEKLKGIIDTDMIAEPDMVLRVNVTRENGADQGEVVLFARSDGRQTFKAESSWKQQQVFDQSGTFPGPAKEIQFFVGQSEFMDSEEASITEARTIARANLLQGYLKRVEQRYSDQLTNPVKRQQAMTVFEEAMKELNPSETVFTQSYQGITGPVYRSQVVWGPDQIEEITYRRLVAEVSGPGLARNSNFNLVVVAIMLGLVYAFLASITKRHSLWSMRSFAMVAGLVGLLGVTLLLPLAGT